MFYSLDLRVVFESVTRLIQKAREGRLSKPTPSEYSSGIAGNTSNAPAGKVFADATFFLQLFEADGKQVISSITEVTIDTRNNAIARGLLNKELYLYNPNSHSWATASASCNTPRKSENATFVSQRVCTMGQLALFGDR